LSSISLWQTLRSPAERARRLFRLLASVCVVYLRSPLCSCVCSTHLAYLVFCICKLAAKNWWIFLYFKHPKEWGAWALKFLHDLAWKAPFSRRRRRRLNARARSFTLMICCLPAFSAVVFLSFSQHFCVFSFFPFLVASTYTTTHTTTKFTVNCLTKIVLEKKRDKTKIK